MKRLLNASEDRTFRELLHVTSKENLAVFAKVRLADVLPIENSGIDPDLFSYALKAHFDFVVATKAHDPVFAVEFDGVMHSTAGQIERDAKKNALCERFRFPLLRINSNHLSHRYNDRTLLAWIIEVYQMQEAFYEAQQNGAVPPDEPFDPFFIIACGTAKREAFPYWISRRSRLRMHKLHEQGKVHDFGSSGIIWRDKSNVMRGIEYIRVTPTHGLSVGSAMRSQYFPIVLSDLVDELLTIFMMERIDKYLAGEVPLEAIQPIYDRINAVNKSETVLRAHSVGGKPT